MSKLHLVIANKNYSSWSLRPWMALTMAGIPFRETIIPLDTPDTERLIAEHSRAGRVPVLYHGRTVIWESLAIMEYLAELFPEKHLWPKAMAARAMARSIANEMHAGFHALRSACPMNIRRPRRPLPLSDAVRKDIARIETIWRECRAKHGKGGKFLFGRFSNADAMYTPVVSRFETYDVPVAPDTRAYMDTIMEPRPSAPGRTRPSRRPGWCPPTRWIEPSQNRAFDSSKPEMPRIRTPTAIISGLRGATLSSQPAKSAEGTPPMTRPATAVR